MLHTDTQTDSQEDKPITGNKPVSYTGDGICSILRHLALLDSLYSVCFIKEFLVFNICPIIIIAYFFRFTVYKQFLDVQQCHQNFMRFMSLA